MLKKLMPFLVLIAFASFASAQDPTSQTATSQASPDPQQQQEEKAKLEKKAIALLEQVVTDAQGLRLPANKIRVQVAAADMLWDKNNARARNLFQDAGSMLGQMISQVDRTDRGDVQEVNQLRQELVLTAGRHDGELAYQLLRATQMQNPNQPNNMVVAGNNRRVFFDPGDNLEQRLLATVSANDPKFAYQKAVEALDKGDYPTSLNTLLAQLQAKDPDTGKKLTDKTMARLGSDNLLASRQATSLALNLLMPGPKAADTATDTTATAVTATATTATASASPAAMNTRGTAVLNDTAYHDLMENAISAALTVTSIGPGANLQRGGGGGGGQARIMRGPQNTQQQQNPPDDAQVRQNNGRMLLLSLQSMLPQIDQYDPERSAAVKQKLTDLGVTANPMMNFGNQMRNAAQQGTSDSLVAAASTAPPQVQNYFYRQAAQKAIDEGNMDKAVQIASEHLDDSGRTAIMQAVDFKKLTMNASAEKLTEIKQKLAALPSDSDRVKYLIDLATATQKDNQKLALRFLDDAHALVAKRATSYKDFEDQLKVADAYATLDPKRSFQIMDAGIAELNELLAAATVLNGFEVEIFEDGELTLASDSDLVRMLARYGQELAALSKVDFEGARTATDKFQLPEPRMNARLAIVQSVLGVQPMDNPRRGQNFRFNFGPN